MISVTKPVLPLLPPPMLLLDTMQSAVEQYAQIMKRRWRRKKEGGKLRNREEIEEKMESCGSRLVHNIFCDSRTHVDCSLGEAHFYWPFAAVYVHLHGIFRCICADHFCLVVAWFRFYFSTTSKSLTKNKKKREQNALRKTAAVVLIAHLSSSTQRCTLDDPQRKKRNTSHAERVPSWST